MSEVLRYQVQVWPFWFVGISSSVLALPFVLTATHGLLHPSLWGEALFLILVGLVIFCGMAVYSLGMAVHRPVGVRLDADGISGFFAPSLRWDEIARIEPYRVHRGSCIGIVLHDPEGYRDTLSGWGKLRAVMTKRPFHVVINVSYLAEDAFAVSERMQPYLEQA